MTRFNTLLIACDTSPGDDPPSPGLSLLQASSATSRSSCNFGLIAMPTVTAVSNNYYNPDIEAHDAPVTDQRLPGYREPLPG